MRTSIRTKMFFLVTLVLMSSVLAVLWKTRSIFFEDKYDFIRQLSSKLSASTSRLAQSKLYEYQNNMALFVGTRESFKKIKTGSELNQVLFERTPDFQIVSVQKNIDKTWETEWIQINPKSDKNWTQNFSETVLRSINYSTLATGMMHLNRVVDSKGNPYFVLSFLADLKSDSNGTKNLSSVVAIFESQFLGEIVRDFKGDLNSVFVVDNKGYIVAHPNDSIVGTENLSHPVVKSIASGRETGSGQFELADGEKVIANFNPISGTNLYLIVTTPEKQAFMAARDLIVTVVVFGLGFLIIGSVLAFVVSSRITKPLNELKEIAEVIGSGDFKTEVNIESSDEVGDLAKSIDKMKVSLLERDEKIENSKMALVQSEKMSAFGQLSAGIAHEVKNPLAGILGHAQLAKSKVKDSDIAKHLDMIEKETRRTKEIIENLMKFARAEKPELTATDLHETVSRAVDLVDHQLSLQGVKILRDFHSCSKANANSNQIQQVLLNLMMNAGHAMENCSTKELKVSVEDVGSHVQIRIKDTGAGMPPEVQKRIFEPFFTTKPAGKGTGLGLSVSIGIVQDHKGKIYVESEVGKGTTFFIDIPKLNPNEKTIPTKSETPVVKSSEKINSALPEFGFPKSESSVDNEVQRDYLKAAAQKPKENIKSLDDIKKEAQEILRKEQDLLKREESKLSDVLKKQQEEIIQIQSKSLTKETPSSLTVESASVVQKNDNHPMPAVEKKIETVESGSSKILNLAENRVKSKGLPKESNFKVNIRKPKLKV